MKNDTEEKELTGSVKELVELGEEKDIMLYPQQQISAQILDGKDAAWYQLTQDEAKEVLTNLKLNGTTFWINRATGQTDLTTGAKPGKTATDIAVPVKASEEDSLPELTVYDEEEGGMVKVEAKWRKVANVLQQRLDMATLMTAVIMKHMSDDKLYRAVDKGYSSFREYAELRCAFGYRQAKKYAAIGRKFAPMLPDYVNEQGEVTSPQQHALNGHMETFGELGIEKLYEISKLEDADFSELPSEGKVTLKDGTELDLEEIKSQSVRTFKDKMNEYRQYIEDQESELNATAKERDKAMAKADKMERDSEIGRKYKDMFGKESQQFEAFKSRLMGARTKAAELNQILSKIKGMPADFESLVDELRDLHAQIDRGLTGLRSDNLESGAFATIDHQ